METPTENGQNAQDNGTPRFVDTPVKAAKRRAFDSPTQANLDALIDAVRRDAHPTPPPAALAPERKEAWEAVVRARNEVVLAHTDATGGLSARVSPFDESVAALDIALVKLLAAPPPARAEALEGADEERWRLAGERVGIVYGCDTPDWMAETILGLRAENARLTQALEQAERAHLETVDERDRAEEAADRLAYAIASEDEIGEHSNLNDPWANALEALDQERAQHAAALGRMQVSFSAEEQRAIAAEAERDQLRTARAEAPEGAQKENELCRSSSVEDASACDGTSCSDARSAPSVHESEPSVAGRPAELDSDAAVIAAIRHELWQASEGRGFGEDRTLVGMVRRVIAQRDEARDNRRGEFDLRIKAGAERDQQAEKIARLEQQARDISVTLTDAGCSAMTIPEGVRWLIQRAEKAEAEIVRLTQALEQAQRERDELRDWRATVTAALLRPGGSFYVDVPNHIRELRAERDQQAGSLVTLREALEPFARMADAYDPDEGDGLELAWDKRPTIGQLRQARAALAASAPEEK